MTKKKASKKKASKRKPRKRKAPESAPSDIDDPDVVDEEPKERTYSPEFLAQQFQPGESGNPTGRAKGQRSGKGWIRKILAEMVTTDKGQVMTKAEALARRIVNGSLRDTPDRQLLEILTSREYPKPSLLDLKISQDNHDPEVREAVGALDEEGMAAMEVVLRQFGAKSALTSDPAGDEDELH